MHILCTGDGSPPVVFESALAGSVLSWSLVQPTVGHTTRTCSYDRAGHGWSDAGPLPRTPGRIVDELHTLLDRAEVSRPIVLVGHSYGGLVARLYAARHPAEVAGLVLVDPAHAAYWAHIDGDELRRVELGARLCRRGAVAARFGVARLVSGLVRLGALRVARACAALVGGGSLKREHEEILAPVARVPPELRPMLVDMWLQPKFFESVGSEIETIRTGAAELLPCDDAGYGSLPLAVLSAANPEPSRRREQERVAALSSSGRHIIASQSGHWIPLDEPALVIQAIQDVVVAARRRAVSRF